MLNTSDLNCFLRVANTLSFSTAATSLFISQQAVSQRIAKIEQELGFPLFLRSKNYVKLTSAGQRLYAHLQPIYNSTSALIEECRKEYLETSKILRVGYQNMLNWGNILTAAQDEMRKEVAEIRFSVELFDSAILAERLAAGKVNMVVLYERFAPKTPGLERFELLQMPLELMVSSRNPKVNENSTYLDFATLPFIEDVFGSQGEDETLSRARRTAQKCGLNPADYIIVANRDSANLTAESGMGVIVGTRISLAHTKPGLSAFKTPATEKLICMWKTDEENLFVRKYAKCLQKAFSIYQD